MKFPSTSFNLSLKLTIKYTKSSKLFLICIFAQYLQHVWLTTPFLSPSQLRTQLELKLSSDGTSSTDALSTGGSKSKELKEEGTDCFEDWEDFDESVLFSEIPFNSSSYLLLSEFSQCFFFLCIWFFLIFIILIAATTPPQSYLFYIF